jgi:acyl-CoA synthetase (AMP-forming)/AMP-acid ligase II
MDREPTRPEAVEAFMQGWPNLAHLRWTDREREGFYSSGVWAEHDLWALLQRRAATHHSREAFGDLSQRLTFGDLADWSADVAHGLQGYAISGGDVVAVSLPNWVEFIVMRYAISALGAVMLSIPIDTEPRRLADLLRGTGAKVLVIDRPVMDNAVESLTGPRLLVSVRTHLPGAVGLEKINGPGSSLPGGDPDAVDLLIGTSGTTGTPKIVMRTPNCYLAMARAGVSRLGLNDNDTLLCTVPIAQAMGYMNGILNAAVAGHRVVFLARLSADGILEAIERERITTLVTVPTLAIRMLASPARLLTDTSSLRTFQSGGATVPQDIALAVEQQFDCRVFIMYGSLDVGMCTTTRLTDPDTARLGTVGTPVDGVETRLLKPDGTAAKRGEQGEVVIRGATAAVGYFRDPVATRSVFDSSGWGHMGDLGVVDDAGYLRVVGRLKDVIIRGGLNISAAEVESAVRRHPDVLDVAAVGYPDTELGERCAAFVVPAAGRTPDLTSVVSFLADEGVSKHFWPERLVLLQELPMDSQGKVRKRLLSDQLASLPMPPLAD